MLETTLCYLHHEGKVLMLHRVKKAHDVNEGKWIGIGGKIEAGETPETCMLREFREETGAVPTNLAYRGIVNFDSGDWQERMHLFTATGYEGRITDCDEGVLCWIPEAELLKLSLGEGDRVFLSLLSQGEPFFELDLLYQGETLVSACLNGQKLPLSAFVPVS